MNRNNFEQFLISIIQTEKNRLIAQAATEILFEIRGNNNILKKSWYNSLYEKYQFTLQVQLDKPPKFKAILYSYKTIVIPGSAVVTQTKLIGPITTPTSVRATISYGNLSYRIFQGTTVSNSTTCINGGAEVVYSYTSVSGGGNRSVVFYSTDRGCNPDVKGVYRYGAPLTITACLPSDATSFKLMNGNDPVSGTGPQQTPIATNNSCVPAPVLLTYVGNTMDSLISTLE